MLPRWVTLSVVEAVGVAVCGSLMLGGSNAPCLSCGEEGGDEAFLVCVADGRFGYGLPMRLLFPGRMLKRDVRGGVNFEIGARCPFADWQLPGIQPGPACQDLGSPEPPSGINLVASWCTILVQTWHKATATV